MKNPNKTHKTTQKQPNNNKTNKQATKNQQNKKTEMSMRVCKSDDHPASHLFWELGLYAHIPYK